MNKTKKPTVSQDLFVLGFFIIAFLLLIVFLYYNATKDFIVLSEEIEPLYNDYTREIPSDMIPFPKNLKVSYVLWLYFENNSENSNWFSNFSSDKTIIDKDYGPNIAYQPYSNSLKVIVKVKDIRKPIVSDNENPNEKNVLSDLNNYNIDFKEKNQEIEVHNIPMQKWVQLVVSIDNRYVDIYIDTVLTKSVLLDNVPILNHTNMHIGKAMHNPNCFLGRLEYKPDSISLSEINGLYLKNKNSFTIDDKIRKKIYLDAFNLRKKAYDEKKLQDKIDELNEEDPI
jgi:hypothetical protein